MQVESLTPLRLDALAHRPASSSAGPAGAPDALRTLTDIAEEISLGFSSRVEARRLAHRRLTPTQPFPPVTAAQRMALLTDLNDAQTQQKLAALTRFVSAEAGVSDDAIQAHLTDAFESPAQRYAALMHVRDALADQPGTRATQDRLSSLCGHYEREYGDDMAGEYHALPYARTYALDRDATPAQRAAARSAWVQAYREAVVETESLGDVLKVVTDQLKAGTLASGLALLTEAAGAALQQLARHRVDDLARIAALVQDLNRLAIVGAALDRCTELKAMRPGLLTSAFDPDRYLQALVRIVLAQWPTQAQFQDLACLHAGSHLTGQIVLLHNARDVCRALPVHLHSDPQTRERVLDAAQCAIDAVVKQEDEA